jgi:hypothetical protein
MDVKCDFLNGFSDEKVYMSSNLSDLLIQIDPTMSLVDPTMSLD